jgi:hypothetical protein
MATAGTTLGMALLLLVGSALGAPAASSVGDLESPYCEGEFSSQEFWYRREGPLVGYAGGERLLAGGSGTCVLGFAKGPHIVVAGEVLSLVPAKSDRNGEFFTSRNGKVRVRIQETGRDSSCVLGEDKCCGEYTYAKLTVSIGSRKETIPVARYEGG